MHIHYMMANPNTLRTDVSNISLIKRKCNFDEVETKRHAYEENWKGSSDLPPGWTQKFGFSKRGPLQGQTYIYYISPQGKKLTSKHALRNYCLFNNVDGGDLNQFVFTGEKASRLIEKYEAALKKKKQRFENLYEDKSNEISKNEYQEVREEKVWPRPPYTLNCLCMLALTNSSSGVLCISEIYDFIMEHFPYYKYNDRNLKTSISSTLNTYTKYFRKIVIVGSDIVGRKKQTMWHLNKTKMVLEKLRRELETMREQNIDKIMESLKIPGILELLESGNLTFESIYTGKKNDGSSHGSINDHSINKVQYNNENCSIEKQVSPIETKYKIKSIYNDISPSYVQPECSPEILIALAIKSSPDENICVSQIFSFICEQFPYYKKVNSEWKGSIWSVLKKKEDNYFLRNPLEESAQSPSTWYVNPSREDELEKMVSKSLAKNYDNLKFAMKNPELLDSDTFIDLRLENDEFVDTEISPIREISSYREPGDILESASINETQELFSEIESEIQEEVQFELDDSMSPAVKYACKAILKDFKIMRYYLDNNKKNLITSDFQLISVNDSHVEFKLEPDNTLVYDGNHRKNHQAKFIDTYDSNKDWSEEKRIMRGYILDL